MSSTVRIFILNLHPSFTQFDHDLFVFRLIVKHFLFVSLSFCVESFTEVWNNPLMILSEAVSTRSHRKIMLMGKRCIFFSLDKIFKIYFNINCFTIFVSNNCFRRDVKFLENMRVFSIQQYTLPYCPKNLFLQPYITIRNRLYHKPFGFHALPFA